MSRQSTADAPYTGRIVRRETHSSRAVPATITAILLLAAVAWAGVEILLSLLESDPLLVSPAAAESWLLGLPDATLQAGLAAAGIGLGIIGLVFLGLAVSPGRKGKHALASDRSAVVADDRVIASAISRQASLAAGLSPDQVVTTIGTRTVEVTLHPSTGRPVDRAPVLDAVAQELDRYQLKPAPKTKVRITEKGALGV